MDSWFIIFLITLIFLFNFLFLFFSNSKTKKKLPPGPFSFPFIGNLPLLINKSLYDIEIILQKLIPKYGPIITLKIGTTISIFISSHSLAYKSLIQLGARCSDRPLESPTSLLLSSNQRTINTASYGPTWRVLRRNLRAEMLRTTSQSKFRVDWALNILVQKINHESDSKTGVILLDHIKHAIFSLLAFMCFGEKLDDVQINQIMDVQHRALLATIRFKILDIFPRVGKLIFRNRWKELIALRKEVDSVFTPLIERRIKYKIERFNSGVRQEEEETVSYIDTLLNLELPEEKRRVTNEEIVTLCVEFLGAASDTTSSALQWIMAYLVKYPAIQEKVYEEIVKAEDSMKLYYLKAVILECLRIHPPSHFLLPHRVTEEMELNGYALPKNATIYFMAREMGLDPNVWEDPMEFRPERFLVDDETFDIRGSREIKMMPFGVGRRICPGYDFAMFHLEYFVANLIRCFEWKTVEGDDVDLTERLDFTFTMKNPLRARISPRQN